MTVFSSILLLGLATRTLAQGASVPQGQTKEPKTASEVIERYITAVGGLDAWRSIKAEHMGTEIELPGNVSNRIESFKMYPNKMLMRTTLAGLGTTETGFVGTVGWSQSDLTGPVLLSGEQLEEARLSSAIHSPLDLRKQTITLIGRREIGGRAAMALRMEVDGEAMAQYFDLESGLLVAMGTVPTGSRMDTLSLMRFGNYKKFGAILMPTTLTMRLPDGTSVVTRTTHVDHGPIDTMLFVPPAAVRALLAARTP